MQNAIASAISLATCIVQTFEHLREFLEIFEPLKVTFFYFFFFPAHKEHLSINAHRAQVPYFNISIFLKVLFAQNKAKQIKCRTELHFLAKS